MRRLGHGSQDFEHERIEPSLNTETNPFFYAKVLLFGEYGIIKDSMGLSIPYADFQGCLSMEDTGSEAADSNRSLKRYLGELRGLETAGELPCALDLDRFERDLEAGLHFDSSIPQGFGVGSSGALVAAVYARYALEPISKEAHTRDDIIALKVLFSKLEGFFHGRSSGIDPLICYLGLPLLIESPERLGTVQIPSGETGKGGIFLISSGQPGSTQSMVNIFLEKMKHEGFRTMLKEQFVRYNDACIKAFLQGKPRSLFRNLKVLSALLLDNFSPMIPDRFHELWKEGIESGDYYLKLCGSGGGGYILGFARDFEKAKTRLSEYHPELIHRL